MGCALTNFSALDFHLVCLRTSSDDLAPNKPLNHLLCYDGTPTHSTVSTLNKPINPFMKQACFDIILTTHRAFRHTPMANAVKTSSSVSPIHIIGGRVETGYDRGYNRIKRGTLPLPLQMVRWSK